MAYDQATPIPKVSHKARVMPAQTPAIADPQALPPEQGCPLPHCGVSSATGTDLNRKIIKAFFEY